MIIFNAAFLVLILFIFRVYIFSNITTFHSSYYYFYKPHLHPLPPYPQIQRTPFHLYLISPPPHPCKARTHTYFSLTPYTPYTSNSPFTWSTQNHPHTSLPSPLTVDKSLNNRLPPLPTLSLYITPFT